MKLGQLLAGADGARDPLPQVTDGIEVTGATIDSRAVTQGDVFFAIPGAKLDGMAFAAAAIAAGAVAVVAEKGATLPLAAPVVIVRDVRLALAHAAARLHPRQPQVVVAVTGTAGKSSVVDFARQIFAACGHPAASLGTLGVVKPDGATYGSLTTPDAISLHRTLDALVGEGVTHLAMEASSHGLEQRRLDGVRLTAAAFTNLGRDHLDYHGDMERYFAAKMRLFDTLSPRGAPVVVNADGDGADRAIPAIRAAGRQAITVGANGRELTLVSAAREGFSRRLALRHGWRDFEVVLPLAGDFQTQNALVAAGLAIAAGVSPDAAIAALGGLAGVTGRLEHVGRVRGGTVVVDYAHKPEALAHALDALRPYATGRLICVFGCGGDRDRGKRPIMGAIAMAKADLAIVTDDNPRTEQPAAIRAEILAGMAGAGMSVREIGDRAAAIQTAIGLMQAGDVVLIAGKGHETGQTIGDVVLPFSDHAVARAAMAGLST